MINHKILPKILLISKLECKPCKGAKFILSRIKQRYQADIRALYLNSTNKSDIKEKYDIDDTKIPYIFINNKLVCFGKISEKDIREYLDKIIKDNNNSLELNSNIEKSINNVGA